MARKKPSDEAEAALPSFEESLAGLEALVEAMEHEQLPLEQLVSHYEKGSALLGRCEGILKSARERIELITLRNQNEIALESATATTQGVAPDTDTTDDPDDPDDDDDIRLF
jgi:exodeoxyribonuclease VII small subunit